MACKWACSLSCPPRMPFGPLAGLLVAHNSDDVGGAACVSGPTHHTTASGAERVLSTIYGDTPVPVHGPSGVHLFPSNHSSAAPPLSTFWHSGPVATSVSTNLRAIQSSDAALQLSGFPAVHLPEQLSGFLWHQFCSVPIVYLPRFPNGTR
ncbi:hypothetical protein DFH09DRAFT_1453817 [Mycena vulgaris]|nr:hypothetical protein DFH09DRAFT_1453817 [Mycena vulgaris]